MELCHWRSQAQRLAIANDIDVLEIDWLMLELCQVDRLALRLESYKTQSQIGLQVSFDELQALWQKRVSDRVPVQYLVGHSHWRQFTLQVTPAVLIPRPETELIIDCVAAAVKAQPNLATGDWLDLGTGSGAIAIGLADLLPQARIHAVDLSAEALYVAQTNAKNLGFADRITFYQGAWFAPIAHLRGNLSGLVSNPPYIPSQEVLALEPEVRLHEPHLALDGGESGLEAIQQLAIEGCEFLRSGGFWIVEMMAGQGESVCQLLKSLDCYDNIQVSHDLADLDRFTAAIRR